MKKQSRYCYECNGNMEYVNLSINYVVRGKQITIKDVKGFRCSSCGYEIIEDQDFAMIEQLLTSIPEDNKIDLLNLSETAELLRVSNQTIYNKIKSGELKAFKVGREWRFLKPDIEAFLRGERMDDELRLAARGGSISREDIEIIKEELKSKDET